MFSIVSEKNENQQFASSTSEKSYYLRKKTHLEENVNSVAIKERGTC